MPNRDSSTSTAFSSNGNFKQISLASRIVTRLANIKRDKSFYYIAARSSRPVRARPSDRRVIGCKIMRFPNRFPDVRPDADGRPARTARGADAGRRTRRTASALNIRGMG
ncbi:hypothetical protein EVAR_53634_1 [Eumeta japonica]|uniref:Uncharacterized protein n=1 Tax=Eumeta variegata TaxID=151549 RepID=A0A4C1X0F4_EUMVA|nr:hypothetical protein EVAR_53634_1 [Eumeta japonica]